MRQKNLSKSITAVEEALSSLENALALLENDSPDSEHREFYIDAIIKRFEVLFEYIWKMFKAAVEYQGAEAAGPRPAIQEAYRFGLLDDPDFWALALDARNGSVHDYFGMTRDEYLSIIKKFVREARTSVSKVVNITTDDASGKRPHTRRQTRQGKS